MLLSEVIQLCHDLSEFVLWETSLLGNGVKFDTEECHDSSGSLHLLVRKNHQSNGMRCG